MNVKITDKAIIFKITEGELEQLVGGVNITKNIPLLPQAFTTIINANTTHKKLIAELSPEENKVTLTLHAPQKYIQQLAEMGKNNDGISCSHNGVNIQLQVDVKTDSRRRTP